MKRLFSLLIFCVIFLQNSFVYAGADYSRDICITLYRSLDGTLPVFTEEELINAQKTLYAKLSKKFPDLKIILDDPDEFIATMEKRFEAQKLLTPDNPFLFDYSEIGLPVFKKMNKGLLAKIEELKNIKIQLKSKNKLSSLARKYPEDEIDANLKFLEEIQAEINQKLSTGKIDYKNTIELSSFYGQAMGNFDTRLMSVREKAMLAISRYLEGIKTRPIKDLYNDYKNKNFHLFQEGVASGTASSRLQEVPFLAAFNDKNKLQNIIVPVDDELNTDVFMRLMSRDRINLAGVSPTPIQADGFLRPSYLFWNHDLRHEAAKYYEKMAYMLRKNIDKKNATKLNLQMDKWYIELENAVANIKDPDFKAAVEFLTFNFYHDNGYPIAPSSFLDNKSNTHYLVVGLLKASKVGINFKNPMANLKEAEKWLVNFSKEKLPEEEKFLKSLDQ